MKIINNNSLIKCKYYDKIFGDIYGVITDVFVVNNIVIKEEKNITIECVRNFNNVKYLMKPENIIEIDGMAVDRLESLFLKKRKSLWMKHTN